MTRTLRQIFDERSGKASDKWEHYFRVYEPLFEPYRAKHVTLVEIGVQNGGSLELWAEYFQNARKIVGVDVDPKVADLSYEDPRILALVADGTEPEAVEAIGPDHFPADIVIDDGSHHNDHVIKSFLLFFPLLADGGVYVVEDTHTSYYAEYDSHLFYSGSMMTFFQRLADIVNREHWDGALSVEDALRSLLEIHDITLGLLDWIEHVHSVTFTNSMIVIEKRAAGTTDLGLRCASGTIATVVQGNDAYAGQKYLRQVPYEDPRYPSRTPEKDLTASADLRQEMEKLMASLTRTHEALDSAQAELNEIHQSLSWQLTKPLRIFSKKKRPH